MTDIDKNAEGCCDKKAKPADDASACANAADIERQKKIQKKAENMTPAEIDAESKDSDKDYLNSADGGRSFKHLDDETEAKQP